MYIFSKNVNYLTIVFFILLSSFCSSTIYARVNTNLKQAILDGINEDRAIRHKAPLSTASIVTVESLHSNGAYSSGIYEYEVKFTKKGVTKKKPIICKQFKDANQFEGEASRFEYLRDYFEWPDDGRFANRIPHFVKYKGRAEYKDEHNQIQKLILLEKAEGKSLYEMAKDYALQHDDIFWNHTGPDFWKTIGASLADFHLAFGEIKENTYVSYTHGDLHFKNIFVKSFFGFGKFYGKNPLTFIDYETFAGSPNSTENISKRDISIDLWEIFNHSYEWLTGGFFEDLKRDVYKNPTSYIYPNSIFYIGPPSFEKIYQYLRKYADRIHHVFSEILQGYIDEFSSEGLEINVKGLKLPPISQVASKNSFFRENPHLRSPIDPKPAPKTAPKPAAKAGPRRPAAKAGPRRPAAKAGPRRPAAKAGPRRPAAKTALKPAPKAGPRRPAAKAGPRRPAAKTALKPAPKAGPRYVRRVAPFRKGRR